MKHIHFIDPQVETFIKCRKALKFRFGWKRKLKTLRNRGDVVTVFYNYKFSSEIMVKNLGFRIKQVFMYCLLVTFCT